MNPRLFELTDLVWPLATLLMFLALIRKIEQDMRPIVVAVTQGVANQARNNALPYAIAILFGLTASASAFIDVFHGLTAPAFREMSWHQYATLWVKVLNPFFVAILAYATQNKFKATGATDGATNPPVPTPAP